MTPAVDNEIKYYAITRGVIGKKIDAYSNQQKFRDLLKLLNASNLNSKKLSDLSILIFSGTTPKSGGDSYTCDRNGIPFIRSGEITEDGSVSDEIELCIIPEVHNGVMARSRLHKDDLLIAIVGATIGKVGIFERNTPANINQAIAGVRLDPAKIYPRFVLWFLKGNIGQAQLDFLKRPVARANINLDEIGELLIPCPPLDIQKALVDKIETAKELFKREIDSANQVVQDLDEYALKILNFTSSNINQQTIFAIKRSDIIGNRMDPQIYQPLLSQKNSADIPIKQLREVAYINQNQIEKPKNEEELVPYVGLPECSLNSVQTVVTRSFREVKGRSIVKIGDILFARIEPSIFNKKYVLVEDLNGYPYAYTSTEFYVVKAKEGAINQIFLYSIFFSSYVFNQIKGKTMGSTGRRRIDFDLFSELKIPYPSRSVQDQIAKHVTGRRQDFKHISEEAIRKWNSAKKSFDDELMEISKEIPAKKETGKND